MRLLICTQKVDKNDPILGFFVRWVEEFAKHCEQVIVICLEKGEYDLPQNVEVYSLGKEKGYSRLRKLSTFYFLLFNVRHRYDTVFVHMNPEYVVLGGLFWRTMGKKVSLWYTHKNVDLKLRLAVTLSNVVFTASDKSLRLASKKKRVMGHGIDTSLFSPDSPIQKENIFLTVGRISETKNNIAMLDLLESRPTFRLVVIGSPVTPKDSLYYDRFTHEIKKRRMEDRVELVGNVPQQSLPAYYNKATACINLSDTGSLDKAVLEALAMNVPVFTTNEAFLGGEYPVFTNIEDALTSKRETRDYVVKNHSLDSLISRIIKTLG